MEYIAYLHKDLKSDYGISFPDFPGCITLGGTKPLFGLGHPRQRIADLRAPLTKLPLRHPSW